MSGLDPTSDRPREMGLEKTALEYAIYAALRPLVMDEKDAIGVRNNIAIDHALRLAQAAAWEYVSELTAKLAVAEAALATARVGELEAMTILEGTEAKLAAAEATIEQAQKGLAPLMDMVDELERERDEALAKLAASEQAREMAEDRERQTAFVLEQEKAGHALTDKAREQAEAEVARLNYIVRFCVSEHLIHPDDIEDLNRRWTARAEEGGRDE